MDLPEIQLNTILTLAAMKTELIPLLDNTKILIADLGLPVEVYKKFPFICQV